MTEEAHPPKKPDFGNRVEQALDVFIHAFIRLLIILAVLACVGLAIYFGVPYLYRQFILPVQTNTVALQAVETQQASNNQAIDLRMEQLQNRLAVLEQQHTRDAETIAGLQSRLTSAESSLASVNTTLKQLDQLQSQIDALGQQVTQNQADTTRLDQALQAKDIPMAALQWEIRTLKSMELLNRARLFLIENNLGLAKADVQAARQMLTDPQVGVPVDQQAGQQTLLSRLDLVLGNLPASPVTAADDLEIAWRQLSAGLANNPDTNYTTLNNPLPASTATSSPTASLCDMDPTCSPTPAATFTPAGVSTPTLRGETPTAKLTSTSTLTPTATVTPTP